MKKLFFTLLAAAAGLLMLCGCGDGESKKLRVGFDAEFPPYGYKENGEYKGFDLDLAREVCKRRGWEFVACPIKWNAKDVELNSGTIDCIWNGFTINGRERKYTWTEPYMDNSQVILIQKKSKIYGLKDLSGKTVAVQIDTPVHKALIKGGSRENLGKTFKKLIITPDYNNAIMELSSGYVDAIAMDIGMALEKTASHPHLVLLQETLISEKYGIGFKLGNEELRDKVQQTLKEIIKDGTAAEISEKYFRGKNVIVMKP